MTPINGIFWSLHPPNPSQGRGPQTDKSLISHDQEDKNIVVQITNFADLYSRTRRVRHPSLHIFTPNWAQPENVNSAFIL